MSSFTVVSPHKILTIFRSPPANTDLKRRKISDQSPPLSAHLYADEDLLTQRLQLDRAAFSICDTFCPVINTAQILQICGGDKEHCFIAIVKFWKSGLRSRLSADRSFRLSHVPVCLRSRTGRTVPSVVRLSMRAAFLSDRK